MIRDSLHLFDMFSCIYFSYCFVDSSERLILFVRFPKELNQHIYIFYLFKNKKREDGLCLYILCIQ